MHQVGELYPEIIDLIGDPKRIPDSAFNEASYDMQARLGRLGPGLQAGAPRGDARWRSRQVRSRPPRTPSLRSNFPRRWPGARPTSDPRAATRARPSRPYGPWPPRAKRRICNRTTPANRRISSASSRSIKSTRRSKTSDPSWKATHAGSAQPTTRKDFPKLQAETQTYIGTPKATGGALARAAVQPALPPAAELSGAQLPAWRAASRCITRLARHGDASRVWRNVQSQDHRRIAGAVADSRLRKARRARRSAVRNALLAGTAAGRIRYLAPASDLLEASHHTCESIRDYANGYRQLQRGNYRYWRRCIFDVH